MAKSAHKPVIKKPPVRSAAISKPQPLSANMQLLMLAALIVATALVYLNGMHGSLLNFDDIEYFNNYPEVLKLTWANIAKYFSNYYVIMYQPLPVLSFALNFHFSGLNTFPMHLVNLFFHLSNVILVFYLVKKISERFAVAIIVALLFALHPMNVEAVTWISARSSGMYTFFYLLSMISYVLYFKKGLHRKHLVPVLIFFLFSLFSKAQAVTLPVVLLAIDYYFRRKLLSWRLILEKIPFLLLSVVFGIIAISDKATMANITKGMMIDYTLFDGFFLVCYSVVFYFYKLFVPFSLSAIYVYPPKTGGHLPLVCYLSPVILAIIAFLIIRYIRHTRYLLFGLAVFLITIALNIQIIPSRLFIVTERYAYFPFIGLFFFIAMFFSGIMQKRTPATKQLRLLLAALLGIYLIAFAYTICQRNKVWKDDIEFMTDVLDKNPEVPYLSRAYGNRGHAYFLMNNFQAAIKDFSHAIRIKPDDGQSYYNRGLSFSRIEDYRKAIADYDSAAKYNPYQYVIYSNRAVARYNLKDYPGAVVDCNLAVRCDSMQYEIYNTRAAAEFYVNDLAAAKKDFTHSIALNPRYPDSYKNRGNLYLKLKRLADACADWKKAAELGNTEAANAIRNYCK